MSLDHATHQPETATPNLSRRAALRVWGLRTAPLLLLAACAPPAGIVTGSAAGARAPGAAGSVSASDASASVAAPVQRAAGAGASVQQSLPSCVLTPQQTEGPYFVDTQANRSDIRSDTRDGAIRDGAPLKLTLQVTRVEGSACAPLSGVYVDVWHCDAQGIYSDVRDNNWGSTQGSTFLRGYQVTDENGLVQFTTIYPGWYAGRTVHIHFKVRTGLEAGAREQVSQLYFDDALTDQIGQLEPYASSRQRRMRNSQDGIYRQDGAKLTVPVVPDGDGYAGTFNIGVQWS